MQYKMLDCAFSIWYLLNSLLKIWTLIRGTLEKAVFLYLDTNSGILARVAWISLWSNRFRIKNIKKRSSTATESEWLNSIHLSFSFSKGYLIMEIENFFPCFYRVYGNTWESLRKTRNCVETRFPRNFFICRKLLLVFLTLYGAFLTGNKQFRDSSLVYCLPNELEFSVEFETKVELIDSCLLPWYGDSDMAQISCVFWMTKC